MPTTHTTDELLAKWTENDGQRYVLYDYMGTIVGSTNDRGIALSHARRMQRIVDLNA